MLKPENFSGNVIEVPTPVIEILKFKLGLQAIDLNRVTEIAGDGYEHEKHGTWRVFVYRREKLLLIVKFYADGFLEI